MNKRLCQILIASSLGLATLAGCQTPGATNVGGNAGADSGSESAAAMSEERAMDDQATIAAQEEASLAAYRALQLGATVDASLANIMISADVRAKVDARMAARQLAIKSRLDKLAEQRTRLRAAVAAAAYVDNGNGTSNKSIEVEAKAAGKAERKAKLVKIVKTDTKELLSWHTESTRTNPGGLTRTTSRDKTLQADGSYKVTFTTAMVLPNGRSRTSAWTKTIALDGAVTGTGTIVWKDQAGTVTKTNTITLGGTEDMPTSKTTETGATVTMPLEGDASIKTDAGATVTLPADAEAADNATATAEASATVTTPAGTGTTTTTTTTTTTP